MARSSEQKHRRPQAARGIGELTELPARMQHVLLSVLAEYVRTGQPVGSRALDLDVSSATVRSAMGELMELGLLSQPHTSAGRTPTDEAFRLWAESLVHGAVGDSPAELALGPSDGPRGAADLLSQVTGQLGFFVGPEPTRLPLEAVRFVRVSSERVMALLIGSGVAVHSRLINDRELDARSLERVGERLSEFVNGRTLDEARRALGDEIERERARSDRLWRTLWRLGEASLAAAEVELYVGDPTPLLRQPEFSDVDELLRVLSALEEKERMLRLLNTIVHSDPVVVVIGDELHDPSVRKCAVVTAQLGDAPGIGGVGVIGPVRMRYDRVIPLVRYVSERVAASIA